MQQFRGSSVCSSAEDSTLSSNTVPVTMELQTKCDSDRDIHPEDCDTYDLLISISALTLSRMAEHKVPSFTPTITHTPLMVLYPRRNMYIISPLWIIGPYVTGQTNHGQSHNTHSAVNFVTGHEYSKNSINRGPIFHVTGLTHGWVILRSWMLYVKSGMLTL